MKLYAWSGAIVPAAQVPVVVVFKVLISTKETVSEDLTTVAPSFLTIVQVKLPGEPAVAI